MKDPLRASHRRRAIPTRAGLFILLTPVFLGVAAVSSAVRGMLVWHASPAARSASEAIDSGAAENVLDRWVEHTQGT